MTDWIEHDGRGLPDLPTGALVAVRLRGGWTDDTFPSHEAWEWWGRSSDGSSSWIDADEEWDEYTIVAYRVVAK